MSSASIRARRPHWVCTGCARWPASARPGRAPRWGAGSSSKGDGVEAEPGWRARAGAAARWQMCLDREGARGVDRAARVQLAQRGQRLQERIKGPATSDPAPARPSSVSSSAAAIRASALAGGADAASGMIEPERAQAAPLGLAQRAQRTRQLLGILATCEERARKSIPGAASAPGRSVDPGVRGAQCHGEVVSRCGST